MSIQPIVFVVPGTDDTGAGTTRGGAAAPAGSAFAGGTIKQSVTLGAQRSGGGTVNVKTVPGQDVVVLEIANGPTLVLHPENARDLMRAQSGQKRARGKNGKDIPDTGAVVVPMDLQWRGLEAHAATRGPARGFMGKVLLKALKVITGVSKEQVADWAASAVVRKVDAQVNPGVYKLKADALPKLKDTSAPVASIDAAPAGKPVLVLIHGTFSNTSGTFGKLWLEHPQQVRALFAKYEQRVYALDHPTLGVSPIANALMLAESLPKGTQLHLLTHSRGGLVAEVLSRVCSDKGTAAADIKFFEGAEYKAQREQLVQLGKVVKERGITVSRVVRVACPARGTLLASKRLDAYVSVLKWTLELAGLEVLEEIVDFLGAIARQRADAEQIPGLAAQIPDSPLVKWLHAVEDAIDGDLRVIAGDMDGDSVTTWLKTLLADAFYWTDNDLVVQTRSMYGGSPRASGASFVLDQGGKVSHFNYFSNDRTVDAIVSALTQPQPQGFNVIGPLSWSGQSATGTRAARGVAAPDSAAERGKPCVFVLPGILGSNLAVDRKRIWLGFRIINGLKKLAYKPGGGDKVEPDGPIGMIYDDLIEFLAETHHVVEFAFDWRVPIEKEAKRLGADVRKALNARKQNGKPVRILAHSMGGVLARTMQLECKDVWDDMMKHPDARLLMLGTPNGGSWAPMQVLSGDDTFGNTLVSIGAPFQDHKAREMMATFPGFLQLQAGLRDDKLELHLEKTWADLAARDLQNVQEYNYWHGDERQLDIYRWAAPPQKVLDAAVKLRRRLDDQAENGLARYTDKMLLVIGRADFTPDGFVLNDQGLSYLEAAEQGDGRVTVKSALLPGVRTWRLDCEHGKLPDKESAFRAYLELLEKGTTDKLATYVEGATRSRRAAAEGEATAQPRVAHRLSRPSRMRSGMPPQNLRQVLTPATDDLPTGIAVPGAALPVTVVNGNIKFIHQPLMIGHYRAVALTGTERVVNELIGGTMKESLDYGQYPESPCNHQVFINRRADEIADLQVPRPGAVIVVGLGEEGKLTANALVETVRLGVIAWAQRLAEGRSTVPALFDLTATLIGSGGTGMAPGQSARLIAQGVREANESLATQDTAARRNGAAKPRQGTDAAPTWPRVGHLRLIELYLDRATEAWRALQVQAEATPGFYTVSETVHTGTGGMRRSLDANYRGADYDFVTAVTGWETNGDPTITYTLDTKRARTEVRAQATQGPLLREMIIGASNAANADAQIGRTLFQLLVPVEMEAFLGGGGDVVLELDALTAAIPWEVLDTPPKARGGGDRRPWAIRSKLLRKLRTESFRSDVVDANADAHVLVIGEPDCDEKLYPRLPGARGEATAVYDRLTLPFSDGRQLEVKALIADARPGSGPNARAVTNALLEREWRIVHIAGHGDPPEMIGPEPRKRGDPPQRVGDPRGVVLSGNTHLSPREIRNMRVVPELVFVNCCFLGGLDSSAFVGGTARRRLDAPLFAAGVAAELIGIGVRCVVATGWAVDDEAASRFATTFYDALLKGFRYIDAVALAREAAWLCGGNTWAAYQCYGDPDWRFRTGVSDAQMLTPTPMADQFTGVASTDGLILALENLTIGSKYHDIDDDDLRGKLRYLEERFETVWSDKGAVAEAFGNAWARAPVDRDKAIRWYEKALAAPDGEATIKAQEQLNNLRVRLEWQRAQRAAETVVVPKGRGARAAKPASGSDPIGRAIAEMTRLARTHPTTETYSVLASAWKRRAMVAANEGRSAEATKAIGEMKRLYQQAEDIARSRRDPDVFYPAMNRVAAELLVDAASPNWRGLDAAVIEQVRDGLAAKNRTFADFWSLVGVTELRLYEAIAARNVEKVKTTIKRDIDDLHARLKATWEWDSVADQWRFVLSHYMKRATVAEKDAAAELLRSVELIAGRDSTVGTLGRRKAKPARKRAKHG